MKKHCISPVTRKNKKMREHVFIQVVPQILIYPELMMVIRYEYLHI